MMNSRYTAAAYVLVSFFEAIAMAWQTALVGSLLDSLVAGSFPASTLLWYAVSIILVLGLEWAGQLLQAHYKRVIYMSVRDQVLGSLLNRRVGRYDSRQTASIVSHLSNDLPTVFTEYYETRLGALVNASMAVVYFVALLAVGWQYSVVVTGLALATVLVPLAHRGRISRLRKESLARQERYIASVSDTLRAFTALRVSSGLAQVRRRAGLQSSTQADAEFDHGTAIAASNISVGSVNFASRILLLLVGAYLVWQGWGTVGEFVTAYQLSSLMVAPVVRAAQSLNMYTGGRAAFEQLRARYGLDSKLHSAVPPAGGCDVDRPDLLRLENVAVCAAKDVRPAGVPDIVVLSGSNWRICGASGIGKSTLCFAIAGLSDGYSGRIILGGSDVRDISDDCLYSHLQIALQDAQLVAGGPRENVDLGRGYPDEDVAAALARAGFGADWASSDPTEIPKDAFEWSGGERQRIRLARALVSRPKVLILDEALSQVDSATSERIMLDLFSDPTITVLFVSHHAVPGQYECVELELKDALASPGEVKAEVLQS